MGMGQQPRKHSALNDAVADEIRTRRRAVEMSQAELARLAGMSRVQVVRIESKERVLDVSQLDAIAHALGVPMGELVRQAEAHVAAEEEAPSRAALEAMLTPAQRAEVAAVAKPTRRTVPARRTRGA